MYLAVAIFNHDRAATFPKILMTMGCDVSNFTQQALEGDDAERLYYSARLSSAIEKKTRKRRRVEKKGFADKAADVEGVTYCAGGF